MVFETIASAVPPTRPGRRRPYRSVSPASPRDVRSRTPLPRASLHPVTDQAPGARRRVVIAEDEALIRMDLAEMLADEGYEVVGEAGDGQKAIELAEELRPDLVVLDVKMPVLDGIAAAERIAAQRIAPVVILTAFSQRELVERARDAGAMAYLVKPFSATDLVPAIEMAVSRFAELSQLEQEVGDLTERLETRKAVDRAKGVLQKDLGLSEPDAFRWIQKTAMDLRLSMRQVAEGVVAHGPGASGTA
ncbi:response regulator [Nocardioides sp. ChNu-153]|nr:response regulator [Nocardioides sp. ChNu-99]MDN7121290.1 response regulator [Nocardioides sp. ChNu-153]